MKKANSALINCLFLWRRDFFIGQHLSFSPRLHQLALSQNGFLRVILQIIWSSQQSVWLGGALNPARALGPSIVFICNWRTTWVYVLAELAGGAVAGVASLPLYGKGTYSFFTPQCVPVWEVNLRTKSKTQSSSYILANFKLPDSARPRCKALCRLCWGTAFKKVGTMGHILHESGQKLTVCLLQVQTFWPGQVMVSSNPSPGKAYFLGGDVYFTTAIFVVCMHIVFGDLFLPLQVNLKAEWHLKLCTVVRLWVPRPD